MKLLSAGLTFFNVMTVCGLLGGIAGHGLSARVALFAAIAGAIAGLLAFFGTSTSSVKKALPPEEAGPAVITESKPSRGRSQPIGRAHV